MKSATSCGGVVIHKGKVLLLYKSYNKNHCGWVLPKGSMEEGETYEMTALREVKEETGADAKIIKYIDETSFEFFTPEGKITKHVKWFLMKTKTYFSRPQREESFCHSGYFKYDDAINKLYYENERHILELAYEEFIRIKNENNSQN